ncbi:TRAP transporter small permease [Alphaproteobacteria bacterium]|jgi:TRAP-type C4-dicarboxylate transport system permease small subunit|nr:TRAP transporter small permease [Alphaproteobacteria bacterium]
MFGILLQTERLAELVSRFVSNLAAIILFLLVVLTCVDVVGRYFFTMPVVGAVELVRICMAGVIFFSLPAMFFRDDHVIVDLIPFFRKGYLAWIVNLVLLALSVFVAVQLGDRIMAYAVRAFEDGDVTEYLSIPRYMVVSFITLSVYAAALMAFVRMVVLLSRPGEISTHGADGATKESNEGGEST